MHNLTDDDPSVINFRRYILILISQVAYSYQYDFNCIIGNRFAPVLQNLNLILRRQLQAKLFDAEPGWLGPKYLKAFFAESDYQKRWEMIQQARNGGSMTQAIAMQLRRAVRHGNLIMDKYCQIQTAQWLEHHWLVQCNNNSESECQRIWLCTGNKFDVTAEPLLTEILETYPICIVNGLPILDTYLRWPGCELFIMGGLAALQVGPTARNLSGARMASEKIVPAIVKSRMVSASSC